MATPTITTIVDSRSSAKEGQLAFESSAIGFFIKSTNFRKWIQDIIYVIWREKRDSNPQPTVLETVALPVELFSQHM